MHFTEDETGVVQSQTKDVGLEGHQEKAGERQEGFVTTDIRESESLLNSKFGMSDFQNFDTINICFKTTILWCCIISILKNQYICHMI